MNTLQQVEKLKKMIDSKLGENIICYDLRGKSTIMDYMVIATAKADTHVKAISEYLLEEMKKGGNPAFAEEGVRSGTWACMDFGDTIVHVMRPKERSFYNLEAIWGAADKI